MSDVQIAESILTLIAGVGIFLIACSMMSDNLESLSSASLKKLFAKMSKSKLLGVGIGTVATAAIQSSGATSVMVIGFVNAGVMSLMQGATIIYGANIGTTITGQIAALGLLDSAISMSIVFAALAGVGAFMMAFTKKDIVKKIGGIITGFGILFIGMNMMSGSMGDFAKLEAVKNFLATIKNPLLLVLIGAVLTAIVQSSSVITSISITMVATGLITLDQGIYLTMGSNIGSCVVAIIAGITSTTDAKRVALIHLIFNVSGVIVFMLVGMIMREASKGAITFGYLFSKMIPDALPTQLAMFHTIFNVITVVLVLPLTNLMVKLVTKILPDKKKKTDENAPKLYFLDEHLLTTPPIAIQQLKEEIVNMAGIAFSNFNIACDVICTLNFDRVEEFYKAEEELNFLNKEIVKFMVRLSKSDLIEKDNVYLSMSYHSVSDLERVGDYSKNIIEYAEKLKEVNHEFSDDAIEEIRNAQAMVSELYEKAMTAYKNEDLQVLEEAYVIEENIDDVTEEMSNNHVKRLGDGVCTPDVGEKYLALSSNTERIADHFINVAKSIRHYAK